MLVHPCAPFLALLIGPGEDCEPKQPIQRHTACCGKKQVSELGNMTAEARHGGGEWLVQTQEERERSGVEVGSMFRCEEAETIRKRKLGDGKGNSE